MPVKYQECSLVEMQRREKYKDEFYLWYSTISCRDLCLNYPKRYLMRAGSVVQ